MTRTTKCVLAGEHSPAYISRLRKVVYEKRGHRKPHGFKLVTHCGNSQCIAFDHLKLEAWAMWGRKWGANA